MTPAIEVLSVIGPAGRPPSTGIDCTSAVVNEPRIGGNSALTFCPLTATAAAELAAGTVYVSSIGK
jgi:hypothetical protein